MKKRTKWIIFFVVVLLVCAVATPIIVVFAKSTLKKASKNLSSYAIQASLDPEYNIVATQTIDFVNSTGQNLEDICLHLYPRAFREDATVRPYTNLNKASCFPSGESFGDILVQRVDINGQSANFEFSGEDQDILKINFAVSQKQKTKIYLEYKLTIPNCTHRLGYYNGTINLGNWYPILCAYSNGWLFDPYYSTGDPFVSECANYSVTLNYPAEYDCFGTGTLTHKTENQTKTSTFEALAVRDFALFLTNKANTKAQNSNNTNVTYVGYDGDADIEQNAKIASLACSYFSKTFGEYPYQNLIVAKSAFLQGGMEYPNLVFISDSITDPQEFAKVIVHEVAHQWWYGIVGNDQVRAAWLDEALAEYSTCLFFEDTGIGETYAELIKDATASYLIYVDVISSLNGKVNLAMNAKVCDYTSEYEYTYMVYVKGVIMLDSLRDAVGKDKLIKALKKYFKTYSYKIASEQNFIDIIKSVCHKDMDGFFKGWLSGTNVVATTFVSIL